MRAFLDVSHVQSLRVGVKWERGNSGAGARGAREREGRARGARGGGKSMGISENTCFTAVHSSAADYFAFRIKWDALYASS